jgi:dihydroceramidase
MYGILLLDRACETNRLDPMQLVDELSMIYTACLMCYATLSFSQSKTVRKVLGTSLLSLAVFITVSYKFLDCY